jgi:hypothetical protein
MITVFFDVDGVALLIILLQGWEVTSGYFQEYIIRELATEKCPTGREPNMPR